MTARRSALALALGASGGLALWHLNRRSGTARADPGLGLAETAWVWPIPKLGDRAPVISDGWGSRRKKADGTSRPHLGVDLMYRRIEPLDLLGVYPNGTPNGSAWHFMPDDVPVLAAGSGVVRLAAWTPRGYTVLIEHAAGWTTYSTHLARLDVEARQVVPAGQPLGIVGHDPLDARKLKHLHFELWRGGRRDGAVDPGPFLAAWSKVESGMFPVFVARNGGGDLRYRALGGRGEPYPDWVRDLKGQSGVYVIREAGEIVYVGESHTGRLYETLTRHFQRWRRWKDFWRGQFAEGHDPGLTYERDRVEVAVRRTPAAEAIDAEAELIQRLRPRDNVLGASEPDDVPF